MNCFFAPQDRWIYDLDLDLGCIDEDRMLAVLILVQYRMVLGFV